MNYCQDRQDIVGKEQNGFHYKTRLQLGITSRKIEKIYEQWSKEFAKHDYGGVKSRKGEKLPVKSEWKSSRKENICVNSNEQGMMNKKSFKPGEFSVKYSAEDKKLPPFRTGKYIPKDDVYSCGVCVQNERSVALSSKSKESTDKVVSGSPPPFRTGKYTPNDNTIYLKNPDKLSMQSTTSPSQGSPTHKGRRASCEKIMGKNDGYFSLGRKLSGSPRNRTRTKSPSSEGSKASSLEQITYSSASNSPAKLRSRSQISQSAEIVSKNFKARPRSSAMENYVNSRTRTKSENMLALKTSQRPKSSVLENSTHNFKAIVRHIDLAGAERSKPTVKTQNRPRSAVVENSLSSRLPMKIVTNTKGQTLGKNLVLDRSPSRESNRYLRKGSDSSERGHQRSKTTTAIISSCSERTYNAVKPRKPRRILHRNAAYVKPRKNRNFKPVERKQGSSSRKKSTQSSKQGKLSSETVDGCIPEKPSASQKPLVFTLFKDKFCMRTTRGNGQFRIPTIKRYRVMVWKIKRISYFLYEKVLIVYYLLLFSHLLSTVDLIYSIIMLS